MANYTTKNTILNTYIFHFYYPFAMTILKIIELNYTTINTQNLIPSILLSFC